MQDGTKQYLESITWLSKLYNHMNDTLFKSELKRPVITVQADSKDRAYGWFTLRRVYMGVGFAMEWAMATVIKPF